MKSSIFMMVAAAVLGTKALADSVQESAPLNVLIYDYADLEAADLDRFLSLTRDILAGTGMLVQVTLCRGDGAVSCDRAAWISQPLVLRIVAGNARTKKNAHHEPLGQAYAGRDGGTTASVFLGPAREQAAAVNVPWMVVLSYAAAHEIGHLLLGGQAHTSRGVMKARWDRGDYLAMSQNRCRFTSAQALMLAKRYGPTAARAR